MVDAYTRVEHQRGAYSLALVYIGVGELQSDDDVVLGYLILGIACRSTLARALGVALLGNNLYGEGLCRVLLTVNLDCSCTYGECTLTLGEKHVGEGATIARRLLAVDKLHGVTRRYARPRQ